MKKIYYIASVLAIILFTACENYNEKNFAGYDEAANPTNLANYNYQLTDPDYVAIANIVKKPIEDKITIQNNLVKNKEAELKNATTNADSTRIKTELATLKIAVTDSINKLKLDPLYTKATYITTNKSFADSTQFMNYIPLLLATKYPYGDEKSTAIITYKLVVPYDTTKLKTTSKYNFVAADYDTIAAGLGIAKASRFKFFSATYNPDNYIPTFLKRIKFPYAIAGDIKMTRYLYNALTTSKYDIYSYDGSNWTKYNTTQTVKSKFIYKSKKWEFIDSDILMGLYDGLGEFKAINVVGDQIWGWDSYKYMKMTGYVSGAYFTNEDWLVSPPMNLTDRNSPWLTFMHVGRYFGDTGTSTDKMRKAITVWVSTQSDGTSINAADWTQLTIPEAGYPSGANWTFITSTPISLKNYIGKDNVRIAFKYLSSGTDGAAGTWEVKNVYVYEE